MFPDRVEETPNGLAVPLAINAEENGIQAFTSVVSQIEVVSATCLRRARPGRRALTGDARTTRSRVGFG